MATIDPSQEYSNSNSNNGFKELTQGRKVLAPVGACYKTTQAGERIFEVRYVCVFDIEKKGEEGAQHTEVFYLRSSVNWIWANLAQALHHKIPFDNAKGADVEKVLFGDGKRIKVFLKNRSYNGKTTLNVSEMGPCKLTQDGKLQPYTPIEQDMIAKTDQEWQKQIQYRLDNNWNVEQLPKDAKKAPANNTEEAYWDPTQNNQQDTGTTQAWDIPDSEIPF